MGNQRTTLSLAGPMDVHTFGKLKAALHVAPSNGQLAQGSSCRDFQGRCSQCWDSPHSAVLGAGQSASPGAQALAGGQRLSGTHRAAHLEVTSGSLRWAAVAPGLGEEEKRKGERDQEGTPVAGNQPGARHHAGSSPHFHNCHAGRHYYLHLGTSK